MQATSATVGTGDPVLLVSGLGQVGRRWRRVAALLADAHTVVMPDNRETGGTGPCPDGFTLTDIAEDHLALMTHLGFETFFLGGISMGGMISQEIIRLAPGRVRAAVLCSTHGGTPTAIPPSDPMILLRGGREGGTDPLSVAKGTWSNLAGPGFADAHPDVIEEEAKLTLEAATRAEGYMRQFQAIFAWDPGDALVGTAVPIAVVHGDADPLVPYENGVDLARRLGVELHTLPGAGHVLESERAQEVAAIMRSHFAAAASGTGAAHRARG